VLMELHSRIKYVRDLAPASVPFLLGKCDRAADALEFCSIRML
jgi:hypothetical protein